MQSIIGLESEADRIATDSAHLVAAYNKLKNHTSELPQIMDDVKQHIAELKSVLSK